jgi:amidohydrolase
MLPTLQRVAGADKVDLVPKVTGSEDFSYFQRLVPGLFFFVGVTAPEIEPTKAAPNHSPRFRVDETALVLGVRSLAHLACDYLDMQDVAAAP